MESLEPNKFTGPLILELDQGVLTSCCLAALRLDQDSSTLSSDELSKDNLSSKVVSEREMRKGEGEGLKASKLLSEWFFSSYSAIELKDLESEKRDNLKTSYSKLMEIYALHILGVRSGEWEYASEMVGYSQLESAEMEVSC